MVSSEEIIIRNREYFRKNVLIRDQKSINFSATNVQVSEIVDLIISSATKKGRKYEIKK